MLDYEWGNPSTIMLAGDVESAQDSDQTPPNVFDNYSDQTFSQNLINPNQNGFNSHPNHHQFHHPQTQNTHFHSLYDPRIYSASHPPPTPAMLSLEPVHSDPTGYMVVPKSEPARIDYKTSRIGLNLGGRTYFPSSENDLLNRLYRRSRPLEPGSVNSPRCQAEGCNADLTNAKHYHRRHKVCEFHSKAAIVISSGLTLRFCQQCSSYNKQTDSIFLPNSTTANGVAGKGWPITTVEGERINKQIKIIKGLGSKLNVQNSSLKTVQGPHYWTPQCAFVFIGDYRHFPARNELVTIFRPGMNFLRSFRQRSYENT